MNLVSKKPSFSSHNTKRVFLFTASKVVEAKQKLLDIEWSDGWVYGVDTVTLVLLPRLMRGQATVLRWTNLIIDGLQNNAELLGKVFYNDQEMFIGLRDLTIETYIYRNMFCFNFRYLLANTYLFYI